MSAHLAAGADVLEVAAWITDPKGGLMCSAPGSDAQPQHPQCNQDEHTVIWTEARDTMASRAALTAEMQVGSPPHPPQPFIPTHPPYTAHKKINTGG